jgi:7-keto-8-aminopelargonate synthetase-like enzyme
MQKQLQERIKLFNQVARMNDLPLLSDDISPVKFICLGKPQMGYNMVSKLVQSGFYANLSVFPSVSFNHTGIRVPVTLHNTKEDIEALLNAVAVNFPLALKETGGTMKEVNRYFKLDRR